MPQSESLAALVLPFGPETRSAFYRPGQINCTRRRETRCCENDLLGSCERWVRSTKVLTSPLVTGFEREQLRYCKGLLRYSLNNGPCTLLTGFLEFSTIRPRAAKVTEYHNSVGLLRFYNVSFVCRRTIRTIGAFANQIQDGEFWSAILVEELVAGL